MRGLSSLTLGIEYLLQQHVKLLYVCLTWIELKPPVNRDVLTKEAMEAEISEMEKELSDCGSPIVFSHNDLLHGNIVITSDGDSGQARRV